MTRYAWSKQEGRWVPLAAERPAARLELVNRDAPFEAGIASPADGRRYRSRRGWDEHLRGHGMVEIGNDAIGPSIRPFGAARDEGG